MKCKYTILCLVIFLGIFLQQSFAQSLSVSGSVKNKATGEPLVGATVLVEGTSASTLTDAAGRFTISAARGSVLLVTYTGLADFRYTVTGSSAADIQLEESTTANLSEVIVVGYGTQKVTKVSGAISTIKAADIEKLKPVRTEEALQGRASGVNVIQSGSPGSKPTVLIRGIPSFSGTDPVVIIDGVPQTLTDFNSINPSDIESINVLKDAATTAIYV
jgi:outer membrane receptor protein involved in Fe transport